MTSSLLKNQPVPEGLTITSSGRITSEVRCPECREMVNKACWQCGWKRAAGEHEEALRVFAEYKANERDI